MRDLMRLVDAEVPFSFMEETAVKIAVLQFSPGRDEKENMSLVREMAPEGADLIVLPELSDHGYFVDREFLGDADLDAFPEAMQKLSLELGSAIMFGAAEKEGDLFHDSLISYEKGRLVGKYRKMHLTDYEKGVFSPGEGSALFTLSCGTRIAPAICFDLWFPEFFREGRMRKADLFVAAGAFGGSTSLSMAAARAAENGIPLILANRSGAEEFEGNEEPFCGSSRFISHFGAVLASAGSGSEETLILDMEPGMRNCNVICSDMGREIGRHGTGEARSSFFFPEMSAGIPL